MAALLAALAFALMALGDTGSKVVAAEAGPVMALWGRSLVLLICVLPLIPVNTWRPSFTTPPAGILLLRSTLLLLSGVAVIGALAYVPLAQVTAILFIAPVFSVALGSMLLSEEVGFAGWIAVISGFIGVLLIVRPFGGAFSWAMLLPAVGGVLVALGQIATRVVAQRMSVRQVLFNMVVVSFVLASLPLPFFWETPAPRHFLMFALSGSCLAAGQMCMIAAYARAPASNLAPFTYAQLLTATILGIVLFGEVPDLWSVIGAAFIVAGGLIAMRRLAPRKVIAPTTPLGALPERELT